MKRNNILIWAIPMVVIALLVTGSFVSARPGLMATGVTLNSRSDCDQGSLNLGIQSDGDLDNEGGVVTTETGLFLSSFEQFSSLSNYPYNGVIDDYGLEQWDSDFSPPPGTVLGLYAYMGKVPYSPATAIEWFVAYVCDTQEVVYTCFGDYGTCPRYAWEVVATSTPATPAPVTPVAETPVPETPATPTPEMPMPETPTPVIPAIPTATVTASAQTSSQLCRNPLPPAYRVFSVPNGAPAYFAPRADALAGFSLPSGTWYISPEDDSGFAGVWIACQGNPIYIPEANIAR